MSGALPNVRLGTYLVPQLANDEEFAGRTAVVIDVLRATTTITEALAAGAKQVVPCVTIAEARQVAAGLKGAVLLGGERQGVCIDGFDLGNSPGDYTQERVRDKTIAFTTTNGTKAMQTCRGADRVLIASFSNLTAVCDQLLGAPDVVLVCAGTEGEISREDVLLAGAILEQIGQPLGSMAINDQGQIARDAWLGSRQSGIADPWLREALGNSLGGRNLKRLGMDADIEAASQVDRWRIVPELDVADWTIRLA